MGASARTSAMKLDAMRRLEAGRAASSSLIEYGSSRFELKASDAKPSCRASGDDKRRPFSHGEDL